MKSQPWNEIMAEAMIEPTLEDLKQGLKESGFETEADRLSWPGVNFELSWISYYLSMIADRPRIYGRQLSKLATKAHEQLKTTAWNKRAYLRQHYPCWCLEQMEGEIMYQVKRVHEWADTMEANAATEEARKMRAEIDAFIHLYQSKELLEAISDRIDPFQLLQEFVRHGMATVRVWPKDELKRLLELAPMSTKLM